MVRHRTILLLAQLLWPGLDCKCSEDGETALRYLLTVAHATICSSFSMSTPKPLSSLDISVVSMYIRLLPEPLLSTPTVSSLTHKA